MNFGANLERERKKQSLTQDALARLCGFVPAYISHLERGERHPSFMNFCRIVKVLNISADHLIK